MHAQIALSTSARVFIKLAGVSIKLVDVACGNDAVTFR